jgi:predicted Zn-dependent protease with MMP-like domain
MKTAQARAIVLSCLDELPSEINDSLENCSFVICSHPEDVIGADFPSDTKGVFDGTVDEGFDDEDENRHAPTGTLWIFAANLGDEADATAVVLHEIAHALGMDEDEVDALGLS